MGTCILLHISKKRSQYVEDQCLSWGNPGWQSPSSRPKGLRCSTLFSARCDAAVGCVPCSTLSRESWSALQWWYRYESRTTNSYGTATFSLSFTFSQEIFLHFNVKVMMTKDRNTSFHVGPVPNGRDGRWLSLSVSSVETGTTCLKGGVWGNEILDPIYLLRRILRFFVMT